MNKYYTYAFLREDRTPYYIGKGLGPRAFKKRGKGVQRPTQDDRILILKRNLSEQEAHKHEIYMISVFGRKDLGTGILRNLTNGGEGTSGRVVSGETRRKMRESTLGKPVSPEARAKIAESVSGFVWYNDGFSNVQGRSHPGEGWREGRILKWSSHTSKGMRWYNKNGKNKMFADDPGDGWVPGMLPKDTRNNPTNGGKAWFNNGTINRMFTEAPAGWVKGMLR
jgi:hypothetical protein